MVAIPGSEMLSSALHVISQSLLIPVIVGLLAFMLYAIISFGGLISEYTNRIRISTEEIEKIISDFANYGTAEGIKEVMDKSSVPTGYKNIISKIASHPEMGSKSREALARKLIEKEEAMAAKSLEKNRYSNPFRTNPGSDGNTDPYGSRSGCVGFGRH